MAFDPFLLQGTVDPKPIDNRILDDDGPIAVARPRQRLRLQRHKQIQQRRQVSPPATTCFDIFSPPPGDEDVISHLDRLSKGTVASLQLLLR